MTTPLVLVDGSSYFFRAFHALPPLTNSQGQPTGAIYGVVNMVKRLYKDYQPQYMAVVFDAKGKTFRDEWYPGYKAHRPPTPEDLSSQFQPLLDVLKALGFPLLVIDGVEADDVIGTLAKQACEQGMPVLISTGDKDMAQLVNEHVTLINTMSNQVLDPAAVEVKFGVPPSKIIDYLTLIGDTSDNIPGVPKCGPKTAVKWLQAYSDLDGVIAAADDMAGKIGESLRQAIPHLSLSKRLVTIKTDVALPIELNELTMSAPKEDRLISLYQTYEFKGWLKDALSEQEAVSDEPRIGSVESEVVTTDVALDDWLVTLRSSSCFSIDLETTSLDAMSADIVGIALAVDGRLPCYIPVAHDDESPQLSRDSVLQALKSILENPSIRKLGQNLKYDYTVFQRYAINLQGIQFDTMLESYLLSSGQGRHDLDSLALKYLGYKTISYEDVAGKGAKQRTFDQVSVKEAALYAAEDALVALQLHGVLYPLLSEKQQALLQEVEVPLLVVLANMECHGVLIDEDRLIEHGQRLKARVAALEEEATDIVGRSFNLSSPKQLQEILYQEQQLPVLAKTPKGQPSTAESILQELALDYRLPAVILEYRQLSKLISTYIDALPKRMRPDTQRVHTSYNQAVTATGRLSSSDPNLQNIPIRRDEGRLIRKAFIAPEGSVLLAADYSQIELRIMAHLSEDKGLQDAFANDLDIHAATASEIFGVSLSEVTSEQRRRAKAINFGLIYGMSAFGLAKQLHIERADAQHYIERYFERYPGVLEYMERTRQQAREQGYVETLLGRRLHLPDINAQNGLRRKAAERTAINAPMQGTAADIIKKAMLSIASWLYTQDGAHMIMQVHDELVFEVQQNSLERVKDEVRDRMESAMTLSVPLRVSIGIGPDWDAAHG